MTTWTPELEDGIRKLGNYTEKQMQDLQRLVIISEQNGSAAADKIKKALPVAEKLTQDFQQQPGGIFQKVRLAKQQGIRY